MGTDPNIVPAVPVVPTQKTEAHEDDVRNHETSPHNFAPTARVAHASTIQKLPGTTGTAGRDAEDQRLTRSQDFLRNGNNGNSNYEIEGTQVRALPAFVSGAGVSDHGSDAQKWEVPDAACPACDGGLWWRVSILSGGPGSWRCHLCAPPDLKDWIDAHAIPGAQSR
jgi:hypothetical protein